jgi:hypothetical protein
MITSYNLGFRFISNLGFTHKIMELGFLMELRFHNYYLVLRLITSL